MDHWYRRMTSTTDSPYVLGGSTLEDHYAAVTDGKRNVPTRGTVMQVAARIRALTAEGEPIMCLFGDPRILVEADRPPAYKLVYVHACYNHLFGEMMAAVAREEPHVIVARVPESARDASDTSVIQHAVLKDAESLFGPDAAALGEHYQLAEVIDDVCLLLPRSPAGP
jgi:hypothetical protein